MNPRTKTVLRYVAAGIIAYLLFLVVTLPAAVGYAALQRWTPLAKSVSAQELRGSVWSGRAASVTVGGVELGSLEWDLSLWSLLLARLGGDVSVARADTRVAGFVSVGLGNALHMEDITGVVFAKDLQPLLGHLPVALDGRVGVNLQRVDIEPGSEIQASGRLAWTGAALTAPQAVRLGDLLVELEPTEAGSKAVISDQGGGPLQAEGIAELKHDGNYSINAKLGTRASAQPELSSALKLLGRQDRDGGVAVKMNGKLRGW
ncbi:MAG: hypothetical protein AMJ69_04425 [Gammaproteobacteria bacterium SG8_47]|nr:MAG: hypothetical protein AMJ69_04425 [Gammaproteobacteria bacterium SG8_47]